MTTTPPLKKLTKLALAAFIVAGCTTVPNAPPADCSCPKDKAPLPGQAGSEVKVLPMLVKSDFTELPGWSKANHTAFLEAFASQCSNNGNALAKRKATPNGLLEACRRARQNLAAQAQVPAQLWMESNFEVWQFQQEDGKKEGLLTGYYEPMLQGSRKPHGPYTVPLYGVPSDLITVKLDDLYPELKGKRLRGRLQGDSLIPFFSRAEWERIGPEREKPIVWVNDKLDAFLLQVQGSGRIKLTDGSTIRLSYAEQNGHPYKSIGKALVEQGALTAAQATIPGIREWVRANPGKLDSLLNENPSVVFFKENKILRPEDGPIGALGLPLTPKLSLAIDRQRVPYGSMLWIESTDPVNQQAIEQGTLAQDTGGAIRGRIRADYFWGTGEEAGHAAGLTRQPLKMWLIWPKSEPLPTQGS
ncbi:MAG TPA: MltA domain-containing protein [Limnobacter sp.]|nr:MltA domain-containing protein [Limnobacter sp.]